MRSDPDLWVGVWISEVGVQCNTCGNQDVLRVRYERFNARAYILRAVIDSFQHTHRDAWGCWGDIVAVYETTGLNIATEPFIPHG